MYNIDYHALQFNVMKTKVIDIYKMTCINSEAAAALPHISLTAYFTILENIEKSYIKYDKIHR